MQAGMQEEIHFKGKLVCLWHMSADKIITTKPTGSKLTFWEREFKEFSGNVHFYLPQIYGS